MIIEKESVRQHSTSCNFCSKGEMNGCYPTLHYPYEHVFTFCRSGSSGLKAAICEDCATELFNEIQKFKSEK